MHHTTITSINLPFATLLGWIATFFAPVQSIILVVFVLCIINFIMDFLGDIWNFDKASLKRFSIMFFKSMGEMLIYTCIIALLFFVGTTLNNMDILGFTVDDIIHEIVGIISCLIIYYSLIGILRRLHELIPSNEIIKAIYEVLALEILRKFKHLKKENVAPDLEIKELGEKKDDNS